MPNLPPSRAKNAGICLYDGDALVAEIDPWGNGLAEYVWGQLGPVARMERSGLYGYRVLLYVCDALGHVRMLIDASTGQVVDRYAYDAWGNLIAREGNTRQPFTWNGAYGYEWIPEVGLYHVGARAYDPRTARWLQRDPIDAASGDPNLYRYAGNDPVNFFDDGAERQAKDSDNQSASEKARKQTLEQLCVKWLDDLSKAIGELRQTLDHYNPDKDNRGGFWSHRKQGYTVPGGHRKKIQDLCNRINNLIKKLQRCRRIDDKWRQRVEKEIEQAQEVLERATKALTPYSSVPIAQPVPQAAPALQPACNRSPAIEGAKAGAAAVGAGVVLYWIISEGLRILFPPRNLIPVP